MCVSALVIFRIAECWWSFEDGEIGLEDKRNGLDKCCVRCVRKVIFFIFFLPVEEDVVLYFENFTLFLKCLN